MAGSLACLISSVASCVPTRVHGVVACPDSAWSCCCSAARCRPAAARTAGRRGPAPTPGRIRRVLPRRRRQGAPGRHPRLAGPGLRRPARRPRELRQERRGLVVQGAPGQPQRRRPGRFPGGQLPAAGRPQGLPADRRWAHRTAGERRPVRLLPAPGAGAQLLVPAATAARREHPAAARAEHQHRLRAAVLQHLRGQRGQPGNPDGLQRGLLRVLFGLFCYNLFLSSAARGHLRLVPAVQPQPRPVFRQLRRPAVRCCPDTWRWSRPASTC